MTKTHRISIKNDENKGLIKMKKNSDVTKYIGELEQDILDFREKLEDEDEFISGFARARTKDNEFAISLLKQYLSNREIFQEIAKWVVSE